MGAKGRAGDLYVVIKQLPHAKFMRKGDDLEVEVAVSYLDAALGGKIKVPTLKSFGTMDIPAGSQSGQVFRLKGQGIAKMGGGKGNLLAKIKVVVPKELSTDQERLLRELRELEAAAS